MWISVKDDLPTVNKYDRSKYVLTYSAGYGVRDARLCGDGKWRNRAEVDIGKVTHWREMIELPERDQQEKQDG